MVEQGGSVGNVSGCGERKVQGTGDTARQCASQHHLGKPQGEVDSRISSDDAYSQPVSSGRGGGLEPSPTLTPTCTRIELSLPRDHDSLHAEIASGMGGITGREVGRMVSGLKEGTSHRGAEIGSACELLIPMDQYIRSVITTREPGTLNLYASHSNDRNRSLVIASFWSLGASI